MAATIRQRSSSAVALTALAILGLAYAIGSAQAESGSEAELRPWRRCPRGWEVRPDVNGTRGCFLCCRNGTETCFKRCRRPRPLPVESAIVGAEPEVQAGAVANEKDAVFEVPVEEIDDADAFENEDYDFEVPVDTDADAGTAAAAGADKIAAAAVPVQCALCCRPRVRCHRWRCRVKSNCNNVCLATCLAG